MAVEKCRKCGVWNCVRGDSCTSDLYDNGAKDAVAAVRGLKEGRDPPRNDMTDVYDEGYAECKKDAEAAIREKTGVKG